MPIKDSSVGLSLLARKKDATAIEVANPDPTSLEFEGNNSPL